MSDDEPAESELADALDQSDAGTDVSAENSRGPGAEDVFRYLTWGGLGLCILLVVFAGLRVYSGVGAFISLWVASKYEPIVSAGFNLAVLLVAAYGVTMLSRRLTSTG